MPQLIVLALVGAGIYAGYRWLWRPARMVVAEVRRAEDDIRRAAARSLAKDMGRLEYDPITGVYRPVRR
ncbi:MAG TPA: hypothetical protein VFZ16_22805 [Hyphomicrobiaceae bacterium]|nr:hypothetical protein [Hyphomicrobiaceae bacterium]